MVPIDQTQVTTVVQGTLGYLDPENLYTSQLTVKSDVYSFGVVLAELLTGRRPLSIQESENLMNLATYFVVSVKANRLLQIVLPRILREGSLEQIDAVAELIKRCLKLNSEERPTMKEVWMKLERLRKYKTGEIHNGRKGLIIDQTDDSYLVSMDQSFSFGNTFELDSATLLTGIRTPR